MVMWIRRATVLSALAALIAAAAPAAAQSPQRVVRRLSVDDAVALALEQNLGIRIERMNPQIEDAAVANARAAWAPNLTSSLLNNSANSPSTSILSGGQTGISDGRFSTQVGLNQILPTGANYSVAFNSARATSTNIFNNYDPNLTSNVALSFTQPLLRNRTIDNYRQQLETSRKTRDAADLQVRATVVATTRNVKDAYWDLAYQIENLKAQQQALDLAKRLLADNEKKVQIGTMAPIDIVEAQSEVARREETVIVAEAAIEQSEDQLRALIFDPAMPGFWDVMLEPSETMPYVPQSVDIPGAVARALADRQDVQLAKNNLERSQIGIKYYKNQTLPDISAQVNYQSIAAGGTLLAPASLANIPTTPAQRAVVSQRGYSSVLGDVFSNSFPTWSVGLTMSYPIGASSAETNLARSRLQYSQAEAEFRNLELQITTQVRDAGRAVETNRKRVDTSRVARQLAERHLDAEEKKFEAGIQISFFVFQAQRDLAQARTVEVRAIADYNKSLVDFEAIQLGSLTGR
jgi:outer membrane protein